jgi:capsular polysaccharide export protein
MPPPLLPPVLARWPAVLWPGNRPPAPDAVAALARIRAEALFWPAPRAAAPRPAVLALDAAAHAAARAARADADILLATDPAAIDPERLEAVWGPPGAVTLWAGLGGLATPLAPGHDPVARLATAEGRCPWTGAALSVAEAVEAQALLRAAAMAARGPRRLVGMTRWKQRCLRPFLTGPDGPAHPRAPGAPVVWGTAEAPPGALRAEDGFLRSVGLGLRHVPPVSLAIAPGPLHFDATRANSFDATVAAARFPPALLDRAAALRAQIVGLGLTKYNLGGGDRLPDPGGRLAVLVPGQVASDASIRLGARAVRSDADLLAAARARFPEAFLLYKPHPDTLAGLRQGADPGAAARLADATVARADMAACLGWADRVATITSLTGFEALLRGKAVTSFGRPFYAGWGLTDDADPPPRDRRLTLDELVAAALILHARYVDPATGLPCPPEIAVTALARQRATRHRPEARLVALWRDAVSWVANRLG